MEKREFEYKAYAGLKQYHANKKRVEFLSLSVSKQSDIDIMKKFQLLYDRMFTHSKYGRFLNKEYIGVMVNHQHLHILLRKPFVQNQTLYNDWDYLIGSHGNLECKTVVMSPSSIKRVVQYCVNQGIQHETNDVIYFDNPYWGIPLKPEKPKNKNVNDTNVVTKKLKSQLGSYLIDGVFVSKEEYDEYIKLHPDILKVPESHKQPYPNFSNVDNVYSQESEKYQDEIKKSLPKKQKPKNIETIDIIQKTTKKLQ